MNIADPALHAVICRRCGGSMDFHSREVVEDKRVSIFHCAACDTLEAVEDGKTA